MSPRVARPPMDRFRDHTTLGVPPAERPALGPCLLWTAALNAGGYGVFRPKKHDRQWLAHRWAFIQAGGIIPDEQVLDHLCRVRRCVNTGHVEPVTNEENLRRGLGRRLRNGMDSACIHGHEYTVENAYFASNGWIRCRTCQSLRDRGRPRPRKANLTPATEKDTAA